MSLSNCIDSVDCTSPYFTCSEMLIWREIITFLETFSKFLSLLKAVQATRLPDSFSEGLLLIVSLGICLFLNTCHWRQWRDFEWINMPMQVLSYFLFYSSWWRIGLNWRRGPCCSPSLKAVELNVCSFYWVIFNRMKSNYTVNDWLSRSVIFGERI